MHKCILIMSFAAKLLLQEKVVKTKEIKYLAKCLFFWNIKNEVNLLKFLLSWTSFSGNHWTSISIEILMTFGWKAENNRVCVCVCVCACVFLVFFRLFVWCMCERERGGQASISPTYCAHRSQKRKKTDDYLTVFFTLLGSARTKAACKTLMKSTPGF